MKVFALLSLLLSVNVFALDCSSEKMPKSIEKMDSEQKISVLEDLEKEVLLKYYIEEIINGENDRNAYFLYVAMEEKGDSDDKSRALYQYLGVKANVNRPGFKNIPKSEVCEVASKLQNYKP